MHGEVRIAAYRRREVTVKLASEPEVRRGDRGIFRFHQRSQQNDGKNPVEPLLSRLVVDLAECARVEILSPERADVEPEPVREDREILHFFGVRRVVHAVDTRHSERVQPSRDGFVRGEHELLDHFFRDAARAADDVDRHPTCIEDESCLRRLHFESSALRRSFRELFVQFNHKRQRIREQKCVFAPEFRPFPLFENVVDLGINSPDLRRNDCFTQLYRYNSCISVK